MLNMKEFLMGAQRNPFGKTKTNYKEELLFIGKHHVVLALWTHLIYTLIANFFRFFYGTKPEDQVNSYSIFGIVGCIMNIALMYSLQNKIAIFTMIITVSQSLGVAVVTELVIKRNPDHFVFSP